MRVFVLLAFLLLSIAFAQGPCPDPENPVTLEQEGFGTVTAREFSAEDETTTFEGARLEYRGWTVRALTLEITGKNLKGLQVCLETKSARGTASRIQTRGDIVEVETLDLILDPAPTPLPPGTYRLRAPSGQLENATLLAETAVLDRLNAKGQPIERYRATQLTIEGSRLHADRIEYAGSTLGLSGQGGDATDGRLTTSAVTGSVGRNAAGSEIEFSAQRALLIDGRTVRLEVVTLKLFGLEIVTLPSLDYPINPSARGFAPSPFDVNDDGSFNQPVRFGLSNGLTIGLEGVRLDNPVDIRVGAVLHHAFTNGDAAFSFGLNARDGDSSFALTQPYDETNKSWSLRFRLGHEPVSGPTLAWNLITSGNFGAPCAYDCDPFEDLRLGYAQRLEFGTFSVRPKLEFGQVWQPDLNPNPAVPSTLSQSLGFTRLGASASWGSSFGPFSLGLGVNAKLAAFAPGLNLPNGGLGADLAFNLNARYAFEWLAVGSSLTYSQPFGDYPIRRYIPESFTRVGLSANVSPIIFSEPLGFAGLMLERPRFGVNLEANVREATTDDPLWRSMAFDLAFDVSIYDGAVLKDRLERPFQTPAFTLSPAFRYDFAPLQRTGFAGLNVTIYGLNLAYTLGVFLDFKSDGSSGVRFNLNVRLK